MISLRDLQYTPPLSATCDFGPGIFRSTLGLMPTWVAHQVKRICLTPVLLTSVVVAAKIYHYSLIPIQIFVFPSGPCLFWSVFGQRFKTVRMLLSLTKSREIPSSSPCRPPCQLRSHVLVEFWLKLFFELCPLKLEVVIPAILLQGTDIYYSRSVI